jgi:saccharopine dehydrogenase (NAD+, L-glutamate forming)
VTGNQDPGYGSTAKMLGQAAACLVQDINKDKVQGGFWTPASIFGAQLITRLESHAGLTFELID